MQDQDKDPAEIPSKLIVRGHEEGVEIIRSGAVLAKVGRKEDSYAAVTAVLRGLGIPFEEQ